MDDSLAVCRFERAGNLQRDPHRIGRCHGTGERRSVDVLHDQIIAADIVQGADVRVIEARDRACLAFDGSAGHTESLDGHDTVKPGIPGLPDVSHTARSNPGQEDVRADLAPHFPGAHHIGIVV